MAGEPFVIRDGALPIEMKRLPLSGPGSSYDEAFVQRLAFENPSCLPIADIDRAYERFVPICMELNTPAGPLDALYVTANGRLIILEAKLWRNPEARRKVVAQVLDYAKELSQWDYEDLQREVSRNLGEKGNVLYERVKEVFDDIDEASFVDEVQVSLKRGRFLLLILGDGIREGAESITNFLETVGSLEFTFGLVEIGLYKNSEIGLMVVPSVIARTVELKRVIVQLPDEARLLDADEATSNNQLDSTQQFYRAFWEELLSDLALDDVSQPFANPTKTENITFPMPPSRQISWVSTFFANSVGCVGVYIRFSQSLGDRLYERCLQIREEIDEDLGLQQVEWTTKPDGIHSIGHRFPVSDVFDENNRDQIRVYFSETINRFVNTFRHRLERMAEDLS